jgi:AcrR family transcriptional regulator
VPDDAKTTRDAAATRARLLEAAVAEFSAHGLAGARVDRIAAAASANKRAIYEHFGDKAGLFTAAMELTYERLVAAVPLTEDDLPGYAGRLFDYHSTHPEGLRMHIWRQLEDPGLGPDAPRPYADKLKAMTGSADPATPSGLDQLLLITGLVYGWILGPEALFEAAGADRTSSERKQEHRAALVEAARRIVA